MNNVLSQNEQAFEKYQLQKKVHNSIISHDENREFFLAFIKIIAYAKKLTTPRKVHISRITYEKY